uniref:Integrin beta n=1 Tax=Callorhinchus milii TaxID=7868 RepID=V9K785_CALMI
MEHGRIWCSVVIVILLGAVCRGQSVNRCWTSRAKNCTACIQIAKECSYCADEKFPSFRCDLEKNLEDQNCKKIVQMHSSINIVKETGININLNETQISPQEVIVNLRAGDEKTLNMMVFHPKRAPLDLYFLMDFSNSMSDDLDNLKKLGNKLADVLSFMSSNYQIGFGKFVDKVTVPQTDMRPSRLKEPWPNSDPPFSFINVIQLTPNTDQFTKKLEKERISGNLDAPEGGFDAILQVAACRNQIGWRDHTTHLLVFSTESAFHYEADGSNVLSGILKRNDEACHLDSSGKYTYDTDQDYPSIPTLIRLLARESIIPIFAVTNHSYSYYKQLSQYFPVSHVGLLQEDSSNIIDLLKSAFKKIHSKMEIQAQRVPKTIKSEITSSSSIKLESQSSTFKVPPGEVGNFKVKLKALENINGEHVCKRPWEDKAGTIIIKPSTFTSALQIKTSVICDQCQCELESEKNSAKCNFNGDYGCGHCLCHDNWHGEFCNCSGVPTDISKDCINADSNSTESCSGNGKCYCGVCFCDQSENSLEIFDGKYCQHSNLNCPRHGGFMCNDRGRCSEGKCKCISGWEGHSCECPISTATCIDSKGGICNGKGACVCGRCKCNEKDVGQTCESIHTLRLLGLCEDIRTCVQCKAWKTGEKKGKECDQCPNEVVMVEELKKDELVDDHCSFRDEEDDCMYHYTVKSNPGRNETIEIQVLDKKECPPGGFLWLIPLIIGLILLPFLLGLLCWKYCACCQAFCARLPCCAMLPCCKQGTMVGFKEDHYMLRQSMLTSDSVDTPMVRTNKLNGRDVVKWKVTDNVHRPMPLSAPPPNPKDTVLYNLSLRMARHFSESLKKPDSMDHDLLRKSVEENLNDVYQKIPGIQPVQKTRFRLQPNSGKRQNLTIVDTQLAAPRSAEPDILRMTEKHVNLSKFGDMKVIPGYYTVASDREAYGLVEFQEDVETVDVRVPLFTKEEDDDEKQLRVEAVDVPEGTAEIGKRFVDITIIKEDAKSIVSFLKPNYTYRRLDKVANIPLLRQIMEDVRTQVSYRTRDLTAKDGTDYIYTENELTFLPKETRKEVPVKLLELTEVDSLLGNQQIKQFIMELYNPRNGAKLGEYPRTTITIADDNERAAKMPNQQAMISINSPPLNAKAQPIDSKRIRVNWTPPPGKPTGYKVKYWVEGNESSPQVVDTKTPYTELTNLNPDTDYEMDVLAYNASGSGPRSEVIRCHTPEEPRADTLLGQSVVPINVPPLNVKAQAINSKAIRVNWTPPPGKALGYKVKYWIESDENRTEVIDTKNTYAELTNLYPYCDYEMNVCSYNSLGNGPCSEIIQCRTPEDLPNEPGRLAFNVISPTVTQVSWAEPSESNGEITDYEVTYTMVTDENIPKGHRKTVMINNPKKRMILIENLNKAQPYCYTVRAKNGAGWGPEREATMNLSTQPKRPMSIPIIPDVPIIDAEAHDEYENYLMYSSDVLRSPRSGRPSISSEAGDMQMNGRWDMSYSGSASNTLTKNTTTSYNQFSSMTTGQSRVMGGTSLTLDTLTTTKSGSGMSMYGNEGVNYTVRQKMVGGRTRTESEDVNEALENLEMVLQDNRLSPGVPDTPTRLVFSALGPTSLKVSWQKPQCDKEVHGYRVTYQSLQGGESKSIDVAESSENAMIINDLLPNHSYMFKVKAMSENGWGPEREGVITIESKVDPMSPLSPVPGSPFTLSTPSAPGPLVFTALNSEVLKLSWEKPRKPNGAILGYLVTCEPMDGEGETNTYNVEGDDAEMTLTVPHLSENIPYKFKVQAKTTQGYGPEREGIITIESQDGGNMTEYTKEMVMRHDGYPGGMNVQTSMMHTTFDPFFSDEMSITTQRMESGSTVTQHVTKEVMTRTMMSSGTVTKQVERNFYEA